MLRVVRLSVVLAVVVLAGVAVVAGVASWAGLSARADAFEESRASTQRWAQLQTARTDLLSVDLAAIREVTLLSSGRLRTASDGTDLTVARYAPEYGEQVERARTVAVTGDPFVAMNVMGQASDGLRAEVLPRLQQMQDTGKRSEAAAPLIALLVVLLVTVGAAGGHGCRAWRTRRARDVGLALVAIVLLSVMVLAVGPVLSGLKAARAVRAGPELAAARLAEGRNAAFDARSIEVETEVSIVSAVSVQADWQAALDRAEAALPKTSLDGYRKAHERLVATMRTEFGTTISDLVLIRIDGTAGAFFRFDAVTRAALAREVRSTDDGWGAALAHLRLIAWTSLAAGLIAAILVLPLARREP